jgi:hypothetical protein
MGRRTADRGTRPPQAGPSTHPHPASPVPPRGPATAQPVQALRDAGHTAGISVRHGQPSRGRHHVVMRFSSLGQARRWYLGSWQFPRTAEAWTSEAAVFAQESTVTSIEVAEEYGLASIAEQLRGTREDWYAAMSTLYREHRAAYREAQWRAWKLMDERTNPPHR